MKTPARTLITNVDVFDGINETLIEDAHVLIDGNLIAAVSTDPIEADGAKVIDGGGRTMIPSLSDVHWHMTMAEVPQATILTGDAYELAARAVPTAERTLSLPRNGWKRRLVSSGCINSPRRSVSGSRSAPMP